jgi:hypothetical protein
MKKVSVPLINPCLNYLFLVSIDSHHTELLTSLIQTIDFSNPKLLHLSYIIDDQNTFFRSLGKNNQRPSLNVSLMDRTGKIVLQYKFNWTGIRHMSLVGPLSHDSLTTRSVVIGKMALNVSSYSITDISSNLQVDFTNK